MPGFQHYVSGVPEPFCRCAFVKFRCYQKNPEQNSVPFEPSTAKIRRFRSSVEIGSIPIFYVGPLLLTQSATPTASCIEI